MSEIVCTAYAVKYHSIEYSDKYITITQNRNRRRVPIGYFFADTGQYIYVSSFYAGIFQHRNKARHFILDLETKEWSEYQTCVVEKHKPEVIKEMASNNIECLKK